MFTQFNPEISKLAVVSASNLNWQKWEEAIAEINEIVNARISYNKELERFFLEGSLDEVEVFFKNTIENFSVSLPREERLKFLKESMLIDISSEFSFYDAIQKRISTQLCNQEMIDTLHFLFSKAYEMRKLSEVDELLTKQAKKNLFETRFLREALNSLAPLISEAESHYMSDHAFKFGPEIDRKRTVSVVSKVENKKHLINRYAALFEKCNALLQKQNEKPNDHNQELRKELEDLRSTIIAKDSEYKESANRYPNNIWHIYRKAYEGYVDALEVMREIEKHPLLSPDAVSMQKESSGLAVEALQKSKSAKKNAKRRQKLKTAKEKMNTAIAGDVVEDEQVSDLAVLKMELEKESVSFVEVEDGSEERKHKSEFVDFVALRAKAWKKEVLRLKQEKQRAMDEKNREERLYFEKQKKRAEDLLVSKVENEYKNACELLTNLNQSNRTLIEKMFAKPTPDCQIRYQEIESLFGEGAGKLPGGITSAGGSHRKICIQSTVGFFDEFYASEANTTENVSKVPAASELENKTKSTEVVGGMFKAHKSGQGNSKLPSVAIRMVCSTLERVGITAENIARFKETVSQKPTLAMEYR